MNFIKCLPILALCLMASTALADKTLTMRACRSVHLRYIAPESVAFYNEVTVSDSAPGSYFMVCGWSKGYYGIQQMYDERLKVLFSVWDSHLNDPDATPNEKRTKLIYKDKDVTIGRFGGEGSGGQSFFLYPWKKGETYRFMVTAEPKKARTEYSGYFYINEEKKWKKLITFSTITGGANLTGYYSFIEDFKRDTLSIGNLRKAVYGNGWVKALDGKWTPIRSAEFTADSNLLMSINSKVTDGRFMLSTGADTTNTDTKLKEIMTLPDDVILTKPADLPPVPDSKPTVISEHEAHVITLLSTVKEINTTLATVTDVKSAKKNRRALKKLLKKIKKLEAKQERLGPPEEKEIMNIMTKYSNPVMIESNAMEQNIQRIEKDAETAKLLKDILEEFKPYRTSKSPTK